LSRAYDPEKLSKIVKNLNIKHKINFDIILKEKALETMLSLPLCFHF